MPRGNPNNLKPFNKGHKNGRSQAGGPNKFSPEVKEAIHAAGAHIGLDGKGFGGLTGFFIRVGLLRPELLVMLISKIVPLEANAPVPHTWDLDKLNDEELNYLLKLSVKAQKPLIEEPDNPDLIDLNSDEYEEKVRDVLSVASKRRTRTQAGSRGPVLRPVNTRH